MTNLVTLVVCYVAFLAVSLVLHGVLDGFRDNQISQLINLLLAPFYTIVLYYVLLLDCRGQRVSIGQAFGKLSPMLYLKMLGLMVVMYFIFFVSVLLLVVPFFFIFPRIILAPYYLLDQNLGIVDSLSAAWKGSAGNVGKIWGIIGAAIVMCLPTLTFIGFLATIYLLVMYSAALVLVYLYILKNPAAAPTVAAQTPPAAPAPPAPAA
jgi:hypothetical protein